MNTIQNEHIINCDTDPFIPEDWSIKEHKKTGQINFDPNKVELYLCEGQKNGSIDGSDLRKELEGKKILNACVLDYLLNYPQLIPSNWKYKDVFFWGTIYKHRHGGVCVCCIRWGYHLGWIRFYRFLAGGSFGSGSPAIITS